MKILISIILVFLLSSCTTGFLELASGAGISIIAKAIEKEIEEEAKPDSVEITFPEATVVIEKPCWFRELLGLYDKHKGFQSESYRIQMFYGNDRIYWTVRVNPTIINGNYYDNGVYEFELAKDKRKDKWFYLYRVNDHHEKAEVKYMETDDLRIMKFKKLKIKVVFEMN
jgi:hypothetical protein